VYSTYLHKSLNVCIVAKEGKYSIRSRALGGRAIGGTTIFVVYVDLSIKEFNPS